MKLRSNDTSARTLSFLLGLAFVLVGCTQTLRFGGESTSGPGALEELVATGQRAVRSQEA